jgi:hypothetical protein
VPLSEVQEVLGGVQDVHDFINFLFIIDWYGVDSKTLKMWDDVDRKEHPGNSEVCQTGAWVEGIWESNA